MRTGWLLWFSKIFKAFAKFSEGITTESSLWAGIAIWKWRIPFSFMNVTFCEGYSSGTRVLCHVSLSEAMRSYMWQQHTRCSSTPRISCARNCTLGESYCGRFPAQLLQSWWLGRWREREVRFPRRWLLFWNFQLGSRTISGGHDHWRSSDAIRNPFLNIGGKKWMNLLRMIGRGQGRLYPFQGVPNDIFQKSVWYTIYYVFDA